MFAKVPERQMHLVRLLLSGSFLLLIYSLFSDPVSSQLTQPSNTISPLRIHPESCIQVQEACLQETPYALGAPLFWGIIVPSAILILLVFGHQLWRRICPLSFLSQIPRALGWQRLQPVELKNGKIRYELFKVNKDSWLGRNYLYLQFGLFYIGLCSRILFINSDRLALGIFLIFTIGSAITVGYLYCGKSWCQYFCPMAPIEKIYAEPMGLLTTDSYQSTRQLITQSMCRTVNKDGKEKSACVGCQSSCIDINAERSYWDKITRPDHQFLYYGYFGLLIGYFSYYYLYSGNWNYYFSGIWSHQNNQLATLLSPGFYLFGNSIEIPKLIAVPLTLGIFSVIGYVLGQKLEQIYKNYRLRTDQFLSQEQIQHQIFTFCTFCCFNLCFVFAGRSFIALLPVPLQYLYNIFLGLVSLLWLYYTWGRSPFPSLYSRESLVSRLRRQLAKYC